MTERENREAPHQPSSRSGRSEQTTWCNFPPPTNVSSTSWSALTSAPPPPNTSTGTSTSRAVLSAPLGQTGNPNQPSFPARRRRTRISVTNQGKEYRHVFPLPPTEAARRPPLYITTRHHPTTAQQPSDQFKQHTDKASKAKRSAAE